MCDKWIEQRRGGPKFHTFHGFYLSSRIGIRNGHYSPHSSNQLLILECVHWMSLLARTRLKNKIHAVMQLISDLLEQEAVFRLPPQTSLVYIH